MTKLDKMIALLIVGVVFSMATAGCEGEESSAPSPPTTSVISGSAQQGFMAGSTVQVYSVNPGDGSNGANLATSTTDSNGSFAFTLKPLTGPVRIVVSGGSFAGEADGATISSPDPISLSLPSARAGAVTANVNPLTDFIDR